MPVLTIHTFIFGTAPQVCETDRPGRGWRGLALESYNCKGRARSVVEVWEASIHQLRPALEALWQILDAAERERADRYRYADARERFIAARGMQRQLLATKVGVHPAHVHFSYSEHGKPYLPQAAMPASAAASQVTFNVAHSGDCIVMAVGWGRDVGIDVERVRANVDIIRLAERYFAPTEAEVLRSLDHEARRSAFFKLWTRKEAFVKALGRGVAYGFKRFAVSLETPVRLQSYPLDTAVQRWSILDIEVPAGFAGALGFEGGREALEIKRRMWTGPEK